MNTTGRTTLYRTFRDNTQQSAKRMNDISDALVWYLISHEADIPALFMASHGEWMLDFPQCRTIPLPRPKVKISRRTRGHLKNWDVVVQVDAVERHGSQVESSTCSVLSECMSATELMKVCEAISQEYDAFLNKGLDSRLLFFDQKERSEPLRGPFPPETESRRHRIMRAPSTLSFIQLPFYSNKTFENLVGPEVEMLRQRSAFFVNNRNWYDARGIPYQMGILMTGEPGTGKSSCIRALANFTKRHIVNVNVANIKTATQLKKLFFSDDLSVLSGADEVMLQVPISKRIYVFEELDALGAIVLQRGSALAESVQKITDMVSPDSQIPDELTLGDLLQVLDGNVEIPGRIVVMTTNRPEVLDPALLRPGRVDLALKFGLASRKTIGELYSRFREEELPCSLLDRLPDAEVAPARVVESIFRHGDAPEDFVEDLCAAALERRLHADPEGSLLSISAIHDHLDEMARSKNSEDATRTKAETVRPYND